MTCRLNNELNCYAENVENRKENYIDKIVWNSEKECEYIDNLKSPRLQDKLKSAMISIDEDVDSALDLFVECLKSASVCMTKRCFRQNDRKRSEWFDDECQQKKKETRGKLNKFRATRDEADRLEYVQAKKDYKKLQNIKRQSFRREKVQSLASNLSHPSKFWKEMRSLGNSNFSGIKESNISIKDWFEHFKHVFENVENYSEDEVEENLCSEETPEEENYDLNKIINEEEIKKALKSLKKGKASGIDEITAEMLKAGEIYIIPFLTKLFSSLFDKGLYPREWAKAFIIPIHKKGNVENPDNYRGISLLSIISKCYTSVLNARLYKWLEDNNKISESQAGFRRKYSTVDQIFTLHAVIEKCMSKKGRKMYVAFVDFKKAFDSVKHDKLLECLRNEGVKGKFFCSLRAMYDSLVSCIKANCQYSDFFNCPVGVRQGCVLSPTLFSIFINQLANHVSQKGRHGIQLVPGVMELFILLFADDIALLSTTPSGLQNQLNILKSCCDRMKLNINIDKTKIMVFRKGGYLARNEQWYFDGTRLEVVNSYCYLGYTFTTKISPKLGTELFAAKGKKAVILLCKVFQKYKEMTHEVFFKIFDTKILPILYSSEIWGLQRLDNIEKIHLLACKRFLGVPVKTPNKMVYGELGRHPIFINSYLSCIRYWLKLVMLEPHRLPNQSYQMLVNLDKGGKNCWVTQIRSILCETGFCIVWLQQGVGNIKLFLKTFKQRLIDMFIQEWNGALRDSDRYACYTSYKTIFEKERYFSNIDIYCFRVALTQLRLNVLPINNNLYRYSESVNDRLCTCCKSSIENENHLLFECTMYKDLRAKFLKDSVKIHLEKLVHSKNEQHNKNISRFVFHAINRRKRFMEGFGN